MSELEIRKLLFRAGVTAQGRPLSFADLRGMCVAVRTFVRLQVPSKATRTP